MNRNHFDSQNHTNRFPSRNMKTYYSSVQQHTSHYRR
jgi:hypothetical protein